MRGSLFKSSYTRLFEEGVDVKSVSELLGHSNITITYNKYVHVFKETKRNSINLLNNLKLDDDLDFDE